MRITSFLTALASLGLAAAAVIPSSPDTVTPDLTLRSGGLPVIGTHLGGPDSALKSAEAQLRRSVDVAGVPVQSTDGANQVLRRGIKDTKEYKAVMNAEDVLHGTSRRSRRGLSDTKAVGALTGVTGLVKSRTLTNVAAKKVSSSLAGGSGSGVAGRSGTITNVVAGEVKNLGAAGGSGVLGRSGGITNTISGELKSATGLGGTGAPPVSGRSFVNTVAGSVKDAALNAADLPTTPA